MRERIDVSEIEAKTKIRAKYLRALENEEWSLLPGPTFVKSFLRTYAQALGLDGKALVEEYRLSEEHPSEAALEPIVSSPQRSRGRSAGGGRPPAGPSRGYIAIVGIVVLLIALLVVGLISKGGGGSSKSPAGQTPAKASAKAKSKTHKPAGQTSAATPIVAVSLRPSAPVYVCLIADKGRKAIAGLELQPGKKTSTYHSRRFLLTLGNSSVTMYVNGRARTVPSSSQPIGYEITKARGRQPLSSGNLPTCK